MARLRQKINKSGSVDKVKKDPVVKEAKKILQIQSKKEVVVRLLSQRQKAAVVGFTGLVHIPGMLVLCPCSPCRANLVEGRGEPVLAVTEDAGRRASTQYGGVENAECCAKGPETLA